MLEIKNRDASRYVRMKLATLYMMCVNVRAKKRKLVSVLFAFFFDLQKVPRKPSGKLLNNPFPISSLHRFLLKDLGHDNRATTTEEMIYVVKPKISKHSRKSKLDTMGKIRPK